MNPVRRPLSGLVVSISVSESEESARLGFPRWLVNRVCLQFAAAIVGQGASVVFGHDWREDGVMQAVYSYARQTRLSTAGEQTPLLWNLLPWPDRPSVLVEEADLPRPILTVEPVGLPDDLAEFEAIARGAESASPIFRYCRVRALTYLRRRLDEVSHARICIGGRTTGFAGRYPGVIEEALFAVRAPKPLYLVGLLGGATKRILSAARQPQAQPLVGEDPRVREMYAAPPVGTAGADDDRVYRPEALGAEFREAWPHISYLAGLSEDEYTELADTSTVDRAIELVLAGLSKVKTGPIGGTVGTSGY